MNSEEQVIDKIISELGLLATTAGVNGGLATVININAIYFGDPGVMPAPLIPYFYVEPIEDLAAGETTGYHKRDFPIKVCLVVNATDFYNPNVPEEKASRILVRSMGITKNWFMRHSNRTLGHSPEVLSVTVPNIEYTARTRNSLRLKSADMTLVIQVKFDRQP